ncbi:MAG: response regulator [Candidatus Thorarchaeota archaeon]
MKDTDRAGNSQIRVVIVDDHPLFREAVSRLVAESVEFAVVGEAGDGESAVAMASELDPQVVVLDIGLPRVNGIEATRRIKAHNPGTRIVVLSVYDDAEHVTAVLTAGAEAYVTKDVGRGEVVHAMREVANGRMYICQSALRNLASSSAIDRRAMACHQTHGLTKRELEVLELLVHGLSNREIASHLCLSTATVKGHIEDIYLKLKVDSRTEAVTTALRLGIIELGALN